MSKGPHGANLEAGTGSDSESDAGQCRYCPQVFCLVRASFLTNPRIPCPMQPIRVCNRLDRGWPSDSRVHDHQPEREDLRRPRPDRHHQLPRFGERSPDHRPLLTPASSAGSSLSRGRSSGSPTPQRRASLRGRAGDVPRALLQRHADRLQPVAATAPGTRNALSLRCGPFRPPGPGSAMAGRTRRQVSRRASWSGTTGCYTSGSAERSERVCLTTPFIPCDCSSVWIHLHAMAHPAGPAVPPHFKERAHGGRSKSPAK